MAGIHLPSRGNAMFPMRETSAIRPQAALRAESTRFGSGLIDLHGADHQNGDPKVILQFIEPKPNRLVQTVMFWTNRLWFLKDISVHASPEDLTQLKQMAAKGEGNIFIGPHPDMTDGFVMLRLYDAVGVYPAGFMMASEEMEKRQWAIPFMRRVGAIPVKRGRPNPEGIEYLAKQISQGKWGGLLPEGTVYWSRQVRHMEQGALRVAIQAYQRAKAKGTDKPVYITPFAHIYLYKNPRAVEKKMAKQLTELEKLPQLFGKEQSGTLEMRIKALTHKQLSVRVQQYGLMVPASIQNMDDSGYGQVFAKAAFVRSALLEALERRHWGQPAAGIERRRLIKIRMALFEKLLTEKDPAGQRKLREDLVTTARILELIPIEESPQDRWDNLNVQTLTLRRLRNAFGLSSTPLGERNCYVKALPSVDIRPIAKEFETIPADAEQKRFLGETMMRFQERIQKTVDSLLAKYDPQMAPKIENAPQK